MQIALFWWSIPAIAAVYSISYMIWSKIADPSIEFDEDEYLIFKFTTAIYISLFILGLYILFVLSYTLVNKFIHSDPLWDIFYSKDIEGIKTQENFKNSV